MFKFKKYIPEVKYFSVKNSILLYKLKNVSKIEGDIAIPVDYEYYGFINENFARYGIDGKHFLVDIQSNIELESPQIISAKGFDGEKGFYTENHVYDKDIERSRSDLYKFEISSGISTKILSNSADILISIHDKNLLLWLPKSTLKSLSLLTGEYEWEVDLGEYGRIRKVIGIAGDRLWVSLINDKGGLEAIHTLAALHISDGQILQHHSFDWEFEDFGVLLVNNRLLSLKEQRLVEVDALEGNMLRNHRVLPLINNRFKIRSFTVFEDKIYFTANDSTQIVANTVGVLDYKTLELLWSSKVSPGNLNLDPPQVTEDRLYVLGAEGTLHIFEKNG